MLSVCWLVNEIVASASMTRSVTMGAGRKLPRGPQGIGCGMLDGLAFVVISAAVFGKVRAYPSVWKFPAPQFQRFKLS